MLSPSFSFFVSYFFLHSVSEFPFWVWYALWWCCMCPIYFSTNPGHCFLYFIILLLLIFDFFFLFLLLRLVFLCAHTHIQLILPWSLWFTILMRKTCREREGSKNSFGSCCYCWVMCNLTFSSWTRNMLCQQILAPFFFYHLHYRPTDRPRPTKPPPTHSTIISISVHTVYTHTFFLSLSSQPFFFTVFPINLMQFDLFHGTHIIFVLVWFFFSSLDLMLALSTSSCAFEMACGRTRARIYSLLKGTVTAVTAAVAPSRFHVSLTSLNIVWLLIALM